MMKTPSLKTERLLLRAWTDEDRAEFARLNADSRVMEYFPRRLSPEETAHFTKHIDEHFERHGYGLWAVEVLDGASFIGFIGLNWATFEAPFTPALEVGYRLAAEHWNHGYATEGALAVLDFVFRDTDIEEIVSMTARLNERSQRVMVKIGLLRDEDGDFEHPRVDAGHPLRPHVLYRLNRAQWETSNAR